MNPQGVVSSIRTIGDRDPVVFLHGGPGLRDYGELLYPEVVGWRFIHYQQRGFAPSPTTGPFTVEQHFSDLTAVLDELNLNRVVLLGHSWGGCLALYTAIANHDRVAGMVLVDPLGTTGDGGASVMNRTLTERLLPDVRKQAAAVNKRLSLPTPTDEDGTEYLTLRWPGYFAEPENAPLPPNDFALNLTCNVQTMASLFAHMEGSTFAKNLQSIDAPVEFVLGEKSPISNIAVQETAALLPRAHVTTIPNAGHMPWHEYPGCVGSALDRIRGLLA